jgi:hypothetical protein
MQQLNILLFTTGIFWTCLAQGQNQSYYYDSLWQPIPKEQAVFVEKITQKTKNLYVQTKSSISGKKILFAEYSSYSPMVLHGVKIEYNKLGIKTSQQQFRNGKPFGPWIFFDAKGNETRRIDYSSAYDYIEYILPHIDFCKCYVEADDSLQIIFPGVSNCKKKNAANRIKVKIMNGEHVDYSNSATINDFTTYLETAMDFPLPPIKFNENATVILQFAINRNGRMENFKILRQPMGEASMYLIFEIIRVLLDAPSWEVDFPNGSGDNCIGFLLQVQFSDR